jgi:hypothetical protein
MSKNKNETRVQVELPKKMAEEIKKPKIKDLVRRSSEVEIKLANPTKFFEKLNAPVESRLHRFVEDVKLTSEEKLDTQGYHRIIEWGTNGKYRYKMIKSTQELKQAITESEKNRDFFLRERAAIVKNMTKEDSFAYDSDFQTSGIGSFPNRPEYTPLIGSPFYKQMYLQDYWEMHSKCFWYSNYSGIGKMIVDMTRNFVMGKGFTVTFKDPKLQDMWSRYEELSNIQEEARNWCDDLTKFGESMVRTFPTPRGVIHKSIDPSTIWEIVTDPENISDIRYYHQQYNTQYQLYGAPGVPTTKYIINQIAPDMMNHTKVNVTSYEKRGRSDLLAALLYFKYYEDYLTAKLLRAKNEAAFIWDVTVKGSQEDVNAYISSTESIVDVPPGSENVHNESITRTPLSPMFSKGANDETAQNILSYVAMAVSIPVNYFGTFGTGGYTKAGALVATEPVAKKMLERQLKMEFLIRRVVKDMLKWNSQDPSSEFEITFPEILEEDRTAKIADIIAAKDANVFSHRTMAQMVAKELKVTKYNYETEQQAISDESLGMFGDGDTDLTQPDDPDQTTKVRAFDRTSVKKQGLKL